MVSQDGSNVTADESRLCRLLVVDDEESIRTLIGEVCLDSGIQVELAMAADGQEAWDTFRSFSPDIVVTDVCMPGIDGIELLRRIRRVSRDVDVIVITAFAQTGMVVEALKCGATNFIEKPFTVSTITREVSQSVARWKTFAQARRLEGELARERTLRESAAHLATAGRLVIGLANEIRTPLTYLKGNAELLGTLLDGRSDAFDEEEFATLRALVADMEEGAATIESNLSIMRRFQAAAQVGEERVVALSNLLADSAQLARGRRPANVNFQTHSGADDFFVKVNRTEMESCFVNLLVNAFESVEAGGGTVRLTVGKGQTPAHASCAQIVIESAPVVEGSRFAAETPRPDSDQSFWLWVAHKAAERNGSLLDLQRTHAGYPRAVLTMPVAGEHSAT